MPTTSYLERFRNRYGFKDYLSTNEVMKRNAIMGYDYSVPEVERAVIDNTTKVQMAMDYAKSIYSDNDDDDFESRYQLAEFIHGLFPEFTIDEAMNYGEDLVYAATGYRDTPKNIVEHIWNTFYSNSSSMLAGIDAALLYAGGFLNGFSGDWQKTKEEGMSRINERYAKNYNTDNRFNDNIFGQFATAMAALAPSTLMSMAIGGAGGLLTHAVGGVGKSAGVVASTLKSAIKTTAGRSALGNILTFGSIAARYGVTGLSEMGGAIIDMHNAGFDDDVALGVGAGVGIINGTLEAFGDPMVSNIMKPFESLMNKTGREITSDSLKAAIKAFGKERLKQTGENVLSETVTEVAQEFFSMWGYNIAYGIQENRERLPEGALKYTGDDFAEALLETAKQTAMGTLGFSIIGGAGSLINSYARGDIRAQITASKYISPSGADINIPTSNILIPDTYISDNVTDDSFSHSRTSPVNVVKVGDRYYPVNPSDEQIYAMRHSNSVYAKRIDMSSEKATGSEITRDNSVVFPAMTADTVISTIEKGLYHNEIRGFTFYDENMSPTQDAATAIYASIVSTNDPNPVLIRLTTSNNMATPDSLESILFSKKYEDPSWSKPSAGTRRKANNRKKAESDRKKSQGKASANTQTETSQKADTSNQSTSSEAESTGNASSQRQEETQTQSASSQTLASEVMSQPEQTISPAPIASETDQNAASIENNQIQAGETENISEAEETSALEMISEDELNDIDDIISGIVSRNEAELSEPGETSSQDDVQADTQTENTKEAQAEETRQMQNEALTDENPDDAVLPEDTLTDEEQQRLRDREETMKKVREASEEWEKTKRNLTGKDKNNDIDVLTDTFRNLLKDTKIGKKPKLLDASARASAIVMNTFLRASGITGDEYYNTLRAFIKGEKIPYIGENNKIYFQNKGEDILGYFFDSKELGKVIGVMHNASPTTLIHEIGHHFLSVLAPDNPLYARIRDVYKSEFDADGGMFGEKLNEAFCRDLERYVIQGQTANKQLNSLFAQIKKMASAIWECMKNAIGLSDDRKALFDSIFADQSEISAEESAFIQESASKAEASPAPSVSIVESIVPNASETVTVQSEEQTVQAKAQDEQPAIRIDDLDIPSKDAVIASNPDGSAFVYEDLRDGIRSLNLIRTGNGKYYLNTKEDQDKLDSLLMPENDEGKGKAIGKFLIKYFASDDIDEPTGQGVGYLIKLDDGSFRIIQAYYTKEPSHLQNLGSASSIKSSQLAGNRIKRTSTGKPANWKKEGTISFESSDEQIAYELTEEAVTEAEEKASEISENSEVYAEAKTPVEKASEFVSPESMKKVEINDDSVESSVRIELFTEDDFVPAGEDYNLDPDTIPEDGTDEFGPFFEVSEDRRKPNTSKKILSKAQEEIKNFEKVIFGWSKANQTAYGVNVTNASPSLRRVIDSPSIYAMLSKITGLDIKSDFADIYLADDGNIFVKMNKEIRGGDNGLHLVDSEPYWMMIPFDAGEAYSKDTSVTGLDLLSTADFYGLFDRVEDLIPVDDGDMVGEYDTSRNVDPAVIALAILNNYSSYSERRRQASQEFVSRGREKRPVLPVLYFDKASDVTQTPESLINDISMVLIDKFTDTDIGNLYKSFSERYEKTRKTAEKEFEKQYKKDIDEAKNGDEMDVNYLESTKEDRKDAFIENALSEEFGIDPSGSSMDMFVEYIMNKSSIANEFSDLGENGYAVAERIASLLAMGSRTYSYNGALIYKAIKNPSKYMKPAKKRIYEMVHAMRASYGSQQYSQKSSTFGSKYFSKSALKAWTLIKKIASYDSFEAAMEGFTEVSDSDWMDLMKGLVNQNGRIEGIVWDNGIPRAALIELSNFFGGYSENKPGASSSREYAGSEYLDFSTDVLINEYRSKNWDFDSDKERNKEINQANRYMKMNSEVMYNLAAAFRSAGQKLSSVFNKNTTSNLVDAIIESFKNKVEQLQGDLDTLRNNPPDSEEVKILNREIDAYRLETEKLQNRINDYHQSIADLRSENRKISRENEKLKKSEADILSDPEYTALKERVADLGRKLSSKIAQVEAIKKNRDEQISTLLNTIQMLKDSDVYKSAKEIQIEYNNLFDSLKNIIKSGNSRLSSDLNRIYDAVSSRRTKKLDMGNLFQSRYPEYNPILDTLKNDLISAGIITEDGAIVTPARRTQEMHKGVVYEGLRGMTLSQLAAFNDIMNKARKAGIEYMEQIRERKDQDFRENLSYAIRSIPAISDLTDADIDEMIDDIKNNIGPGSVTYEEGEPGRIRKAIAQLSLVEQVIERFSPAMHSIIFGGSAINGQYNGYNLNTAYDMMYQSIANRKSRLADKFAELFEKKASLMDIESQEIFDNKRTVLGTMDAETFQKKRNISFGNISIDKAEIAKASIDKSILDKNRKYKAIADYILSVQKEYEKAINDPEASPEAIAEAKRKYDETMNGIDSSNEYSMEMLMGIYMYSKQEGGLKRLIPNGESTSNNIPINKILWVIDQFENNPEYKPYREFADYLQKVIAERFSEVSEVYFNMTGEILGEEDFYFMLTSLYEENMGIIKPDNRDQINYSIADWFTEKRTGSSKALDLHVLGIASKAIESQEAYIYLTEILSNLRKMVADDSDFTRVIRDQYGKKGASFIEQVRKWIDFQMRSPIIDSDMNKIMSILRRNFTSSVLLGNVSTILQQAPAIFLAGRHTGMVNMLKGTIEYFSNLKENQDFVYSKSGQMRARARMENEAWVADLKHMKRYENGTFKRIMESAGMSATKKGYRILILKLMEAQNWVDRHVANAMWYSIYKSNKANMEKTQGMSEATFDQMCSEDATQKTLSLNPTSNAKDNALMYNDKDSGVRNMFMFTAQLNKQFNEIYNDFMKFIENTNLENFGNIMKSAFYLGLVSMLTAAISGRHFKDDDDEDGFAAMAGRIAQATAAEMLGMIPAVGPGVRDVATGAVYADQGVSADIINLFKVIGNWNDKEGLQRWNAISSVIGDIFNLAGVPFNAPRKLIKVFYNDDGMINFGEIINSQWGDAYSRWIDG